MIYTLILLILSASSVLAQGGPSMPYTIDSVPAGYHLCAYDDCGVLARQPHVDMADSYIWTFNLSDTDADVKSRSAVFSYKQVNAVYDDLDPKLDYVVAVTYASDHVYNRIQSLWADGIQLHEPYALPKAKAERLIMRLPCEVTQDGKMKLELKIHGEVNATCSIIELWASAPPPVAFRFGEVSGLHSDLTGRVLDLAYDGLAGVDVRLSRAGASPVTARSDSSGEVRFDRKLVESMGGSGDLTLTATHDGKEISRMVKAENLFFDPIRYRPIPAQTADLESNVMLLDGDWQINPGDGKWGDFKVPGQWLQQGYDVPQDKPVAVAHEFTVPKEWAGYRIVLRFDAIHAGTEYALNGKRLGHSENLFTPVEWEITDLAKPGETNRLDLTMTVATVSERLSYSSGYAFHNLGGIDRSVRLFALPKTSIRDMRISTNLDKDYRDADLHVNLNVENPQNAELVMSLRDAQGKPVELSQSKWTIGSGSSDLTTHVRNPLKWNAEQPNLYALTLELTQDGKLLERIERNVGFREIEVKGSQLYINGVRVKLAGACHHEHDPLTGRADTMHRAVQDVRMLKGANLNYLRTAHYPPTQELLDACDRLGVYVEVEAPFCWVGATDGLTDAVEVLTPTSAMVDYCHVHPSVVIWSIANESSFNEAFERSDALIKELDPTRPTTFNNPDPKRICDIVNYHYPSMPYDNLDISDPRPILLGEYYFPVCHEQTDVRINPGLRELWGMGQSDPDSDFAKACSASYDTSFLKPGARPGVWSSIYNSNRLIGAAIWAEIDEPFYFEGGKHVGYAWVHGFWGLIDGWRRPKPEWWLAKMIFSPVWFPERHVEFMEGQASIRIPVENRYSFTDLKALTFNWEVRPSQTPSAQRPVPLRKGDISACAPPYEGGAGQQAGGGSHAYTPSAQRPVSLRKGDSIVGLAPASRGTIEIPIPVGTQEGDKLILRVYDSRTELISAFEATLGKEKPRAIPVPSGAPRWKDNGNVVSIEGEGFSLTLDKTSGELKGSSALMKFPAVHVTRYDFGDLAALSGGNAQHYADLPDAATRTIDGVSAEETPDGLKLTVRDHYQDFAGSVTWLIDGKGVGSVSYDYTYSGEEMNTREAGIEFLLKPECDEVKWKRWSEWGVYPEGSISRTEGSAKAHRDKRWGKERWNVEPEWPWSLDETEMGTADFRSIKFNVYEASLVSPSGAGLRVDSNADAHVRPALMDGGAKLHVLNQCRMGQVVLRKGDHVKGEFAVSLLP